MNKSISINYDLCKPKECAPDTGICPAAKACRRRLLEQEEAYEPPMLLSEQMCTGCADCARECPFGAIKLKSGNG